MFDQFLYSCKFKITAANMSMPVGDLEKGKKAFIYRCSRCHTIEKDAEHRIGPNLYGVYGRKTGQAAGYSYTDANKNKGIFILLTFNYRNFKFASFFEKYFFLAITWNDETLFAYLENPQEYIPGTKMVFIARMKPQERADLVAYIKQASQS